MASNYWRDREADWQKQCAKQNKNWSKEIDQAYQDLASEVDQLISSFVSEYGDANGMTMAQAKYDLSTVDMKRYEALAKRYCDLAAQDLKSGSERNAYIYFSQQANEEMARYNAGMKYNRLKMLQSQLKLRVLNAQSRTQNIIQKAATQRAMNVFQRQAGILGRTVLNNINQVPNIVQASFHGATFSQRIWGKHQNKLRNTLNQLLAQGLIMGKGPKQLASQIRKATGVKAREAQTLMRTELARVQIEAQKSSYDASGFDEFEFMADLSCCPQCQANDGKHFKVKDMTPGGNAPPMHPNCRCSTAPYVDDDDYEEWLNTYSEHGLDYEEWKKLNQLPEVPEPYEKNFRKMSPAELVGVRPGAVEYESGYDESKHSEEIPFAKWLSEKLGGKVICQSERDSKEIQWPDYFWKNEYWELKTPISNSKTSIERNTRKATHQVRTALSNTDADRGGVIIDISKIDMPVNDAIEHALHVIARSGNGRTGLLIVDNGEVTAAYYPK